MFEYVIVIFPESRTVMIDGKAGGFTGKPFRVQRGTHTFWLSFPQDYSPTFQKMVVQNTAPNNPMRITFEKI